MLVPTIESEEVALVDVHRQLWSPVLIGRDDLLALARRRLESAGKGVGHVLFLAGEAGIGKTRLLGAIEREAWRGGMRVARAAAFPQDLELAGGLLIDLGHELAVSGRAADAERGPSITDRLHADAPRGSRSGDPHRRRRLLVLDLVDLVAGLADEGSVLLALEDLHWADDLALEVLGQLARRVSSRPMIVVGTYRSDELYPRVPMREWRGRLLTQRLAEEARLGRLSFDETSSMVRLLLGQPLPTPRALAEALYARSDGIPLHVEELVGALGASAEGDEPVPDTLTDAILQRRSALSMLAAHVAGAAAIVGRSFDLDLLAAVADRSAAEAGSALDELQERYFVVPAGDSRWFDFRHALIRDALEHAVPIAERRILHERVAAEAESRPELGGDGFRSAHYEAAGRQVEAHRLARAAAERAASLSAHREALDLYRRAVRCAPAELPAEELATLLAARAAEAAATDDNEGAAKDYVQARRLLLDGDRPNAAAALLPALVAARHLVGDALEPRIELLSSGLDEIAAAALPQREASGLRARLLAGVSAAYMLDRQLDSSIASGEEALHLAAHVGDETTELNALTTLGSSLVFAGRMEEGWSRLEQGVKRARRHRREAEAARAYRMIGSSASVLVEYERAERWLREGIDYAERTEQWNHRHYMAAHLGHVLWAIGHWPDAAGVTDHALADGRGGVTTRITALHVRGYLALGRAEWQAAEMALDEARHLGDEMRELQRFSPALWGLAEAALLQGRAADAAELTEDGFRASAAVRDAAYLYPFLVTGTRARLELGDPLGAERWVQAVSEALFERSIPGTLAAVDHARGLLHLAAGATGRARTALSAALEGWNRRRRAWEGGFASIDLARCAHRSNRPAEAAALVAQALADAEHIGSSVHAAPARQLDALVRQRGIRDEPWAPLTAREFEVARLIAEGRTNRQIADDLHIAPKTVGAHVEHILSRLGAGRRAEIAAWAAGVRSESGAEPADS